MLIEIREVKADMLPVYATIPISFKVDSIFRVDIIDNGLGGFRLVEEKVNFYIKDYDNVIEDDKGPEDWAKHFDISNWGIFIAFSDNRPVGGATVAFDTPAVNMLESRKDLAVLWDIRIHPDIRRHGIGSKLFKYSADWAKKRGCKRFKVETQNINISACHFYAKQGCKLGAIHRYGYSNCPQVAHEAMFLWYLDL